MIALLLRPRGIGVPDSPPQLFQYGNHDHDQSVRVYVPFIERHLPDEEAWAAQFTDEQRLALFKQLHGNRKGRRTQRLVTLFDA